LNEYSDVITQVHNEFKNAGDLLYNEALEIIQTGIPKESIVMMII
jgi:hypothetical protein